MTTTWTASMACCWQQREGLVMQTGPWTAESVTVTCDVADIERAARDQLGIRERTDSEGRSLIGACLIGCSRVMTHSPPSPTGSRA